MSCSHSTCHYWMHEFTGYAHALNYLSDHRKPNINTLPEFLRLWKSTTSVTNIYIYIYIYTHIFFLSFIVKELVALCWSIAEFISLTSVQMPCESISNTSISLSLCVCVCSRTSSSWMATSYKNTTGLHRLAEGNGTGSKPESWGKLRRSPSPGGGNIMWSGSACEWMDRSSAHRQRDRRVHSDRNK